MATLVALPQIVVGDTSEVHSSAQNPLGTRARDAAGNEYIYLKGVASTVQGSWVSFDEAHLTTLAVANAKGRIAVAMAAVVADKYGWYCIYGTAPAKVLAAFADNGVVYLTATAGSIDDADVAGDLVSGAMGRSAIDGPATGQATMELSYPFVDDTADD